MNSRELADSLTKLQIHQSLMIALKKLKIKLKTKNFNYTELVCEKS